MGSTTTDPIPMLRPRVIRREAPRAVRFAHWPAALVIIASVGVSALYVWFICPLGLAPDEAHYWEWSRNLDWSYYSKGPLVAWLIRASCELFGEWSIRATGDLSAAVRMPALISHAAVMVGSYLLALWGFRSRSLGAAVVALAATLPMVRIGAVLTTIDPPFLACWCWALICAGKALEANRTGWWLGAGCFTALGILAKYTMMLFPAAVAGYLLWHRRAEFRRVGVWLFAAVAMTAWVPILLWNSHHDWVSFRHVYGQIGAGEARGLRFHWLGPLTFVGSQFGMMFGLLLPAFLAAMWRFRPPHAGNDHVRLLWWCAFPVWCVFGLASFVKPGQANWPAPAYVSGLILTAAWLREQWMGPSRRLVLWCLSINTVLSLLVAIGVHFPARFRPLLIPFVSMPSNEEPTPVRKLDITARLCGWKRLAGEVDDLRQRIAGETGREPVLAGSYWTIPGQLRFYCDGHPAVYSVGVPNRSDRHSQFDFWRPNPISDAQAFLGQTFVIVGDVSPHLAAAFERVDEPRRVIHVEHGVPVQAWWVWVCRGFRGFDGASSHQPGY